MSNREVKPNYSQKYLRGSIKDPLIRVTIEVPRFVPESALNLEIHGKFFHFDSSFPRWTCSIDVPYIHNIQVSRTPKDVVFKHGKFVVFLRVKNFNDVFSVLYPDKVQALMAEKAAKLNQEATREVRRAVQAKHEAKTKVEVLTETGESAPIRSWKHVAATEQLDLATEAARQVAAAAAEREKKALERLAQAKSRLEKAKKGRGATKNTREELRARAEANVDARKMKGKGAGGKAKKN